ncbi:hypothetical protein [Ruegeria lacuscaerulensis]|uniref:hypothetical protein n=1 Tax=Ruegeria lacuscaerulensis TaxID=55218 RepID=UPI001480DF52|nr:hypothetical protein [Ruegeria lacuscaerulensis]
MTEAPELTTYRQACEYQLSEWVAGRPWHNPFNHDNTRHDGDRSEGECCPDFSCCNPDMLAPKEAREAFANAGDDTRFEMLGMFLGNMAQSETDAKVHIAGGTSETTQ